MKSMVFTSPLEAEASASSSNLTSLSIMGLGPEIECLLLSCFFRSTDGWDCEGKMELLLYDRFLQANCMTL